VIRYERRKERNQTCHIRVLDIAQWICGDRYCTFVQDVPLLIFSSDTQGRLMIPVQGSTEHIDTCMHAYLLWDISLWENTTQIIICSGTASLKVFPKNPPMVPSSRRRISKLTGQQQQA
jgi:hypothetical protein